MLQESRTDPFSELINDFIVPWTNLVESEKLKYNYGGCRTWIVCCRGSSYVFFVAFHLRAYCVLDCFTSHYSQSSSHKCLWPHKWRLWRMISWFSLLLCVLYSIHNCFITFVRALIVCIFYEHFVFCVYTFLRFIWWNKMVEKMFINSSCITYCNA